MSIGAEGVDNDGLLVVVALAGGIEKEKYQIYILN